MDEYGYVVKKNMHVAIIDKYYNTREIRINIHLLYRGVITLAPLTY